MVPCCPLLANHRPHLAWTLFFNIMTSAVTPRDGSTFYYALLKTAPQQRADVCALLRFCDVLASVLHDVSEPAVAEQKIHWWHQEIERLQQGEARHPAATIVHPVIQRYSLATEKFLSILQANNNEKFINASDDDAFQLRLLTDYGMRLELCSTVLLHNTDSTVSDWQAAPEWASGFGTFDRLRQLVHLHHRAYPVLPDSDYQNAGTEPANLVNPDAADTVLALLTARLEQTTAQFHTALTQPMTDDRLTPVYLCGKLRLAQLQLWQKEPLALLEHYTSLTPIRKYWISLRARGQLRSVRQFP